MADATSAGSPRRPRVCKDRDASAALSFEVIRSVNGVRTSPGATALTRTPSWAHSKARVLVRLATPARAARPPPGRPSFA